MLTIGSLFSGIGGLDLGLERAGMNVVWQVEIDAFCQRVLAKHWPNVERFKDVKEVGKHNLKPVDLICGGDPCQGNSNAKTHGTTADTLGGEFIRVIDELRPRVVLRENPSVVRKEAPWPWYRFARELQGIGYHVAPFRWRACCAGADIRRERLFVLAVLPIAKCKGLEGHECEVMARTKARRQDTDVAGPDRWHSTPGICGKSDVVSNRLHRLKALGNAVVPQVAEYIGRAIVGHYEETNKEI